MPLLKVPSSVLRTQFATKQQAPARQQTIRDWLLLGHRYLSLSLGMVAVISGLTGSALVFGVELNRAIHPDLVGVKPEAASRPLQELLEAAQAAYPGETPYRFKPPISPDSAFEVRMDSDAGRRVYLNPYTAAVLGDRSPTGTIWGVLFYLHTELLAGEVGHAIIGMSGVSLVVVIVTGLVLSLRRGRLREIFAIKWRASGRRINYDAHRVIGVVAAVALIASATSGVYMVFALPIERGVNAIAGNPARRAAPHVLQPAPLARALPIDTLLRTADAALPGATTTWITVPPDPAAPVSIRKRLPGERHPNGRSVVYVDRVTGEVMMVDNALLASPITRFFNSIYPVHIWGPVGGLATQVLHAAVGLVPAVLFGTGFAIWLRRSRKK